MNTALKSRARWVAACVIGLGLGVGILTGAGVASADIGTDAGNTTNMPDTTTGVVAQQKPGWGKSTISPVIDKETRLKELATARISG